MYHRLGFIYIVPLFLFLGCTLFQQERETITIAQLPIQGDNLCAWMSNELYNSFSRRKELATLPMMVTTHYAPTGNCRALFDIKGVFYQNFCLADYVIAAELIEHDLIRAVPSGFGNRAMQRQEILLLKMRLQVTDMRDSKPRIALLEIVAHEASLSGQEKEAACRKGYLQLLTKMEHRVMEAIYE